MTWQRRHCIECWHDMEHCATCGCHDNDTTEGDTTNGTAVDQARHSDA